MFWTSPLPYGVMNVPLISLIDVDECGIMLEGCNRHYGKAYFGARVIEKGHYGKGVKWTVTLAVAATGERFCWVEEKAGTTAAAFANFTQYILNGIDPGIYVGPRTILMDNLNSHRTPIIDQLITATGHQLIYGRTLRMLP